MNLEELLVSRGTDLPSVVAKVHETIGLRSDEVLLAVGSLAEGLGNSKSDVDLLWITPRDESGLPEKHELTLVVGRCVVDVRVLRLAELEELLARFEAWAQRPWNTTHAVKFTMEERTLLHRLIHGQLLHEDQGGQLASRKPSSLALARLKLHIARHMARTIQVDMVGYRDSGDFRTLVFAAQELLGHAVDALLAGYQFTNPVSKWRSRLLERVPSDWEQSLSSRPTGLTAGEVFWRLHRAPERPEERPVFEHAFRITTFARAVFLWAEFQLVRGSDERPEPITWPQVERQPEDSPLPYLDLDVDYHVRDGGVAIARLNEFGVMVEISMREFALVLLLDGTTTVREAKAIHGSSGGEVASTVVERLLSVLGQARFSVSLPTGWKGA